MQFSRVIEDYRNVDLGALKFNSETVSISGMGNLFSCQCECIYLNNSTVARAL